MNLTELEVSQNATILSFDKIAPSFRRRLMDLGIYEGAHVILLNKLSFGRLFLVEVDDIELCLRQQDASLIEVKI